MKWLCLSLFVVVCSTTSCLVAEQVELPRSTPAAQGVSSTAILNFVEQCEAKVDAIHSLILVRHGHVIAEGSWAPYTPKSLHPLNSLTKSFVGTAIGLAVAEGKVDLDAPIVRYFPNDAPRDASPELLKLRVRDLLTMRTGHRAAEIDQFFFHLSFLPAPNLPKRFFGMPIVDPVGTKFVYDSAGSHMLSEIVQKTTGMTVEEYLKQRLFQPLGIRKYSWWKIGGVNIGGYGLFLPTEAIAKFGQVYLDHGQWNGRQLIPRTWVEEATRKQVDNHTPGDATSDWAQGYGYQFWRCRYGFYRGDGARGQLCIVMPQYDAVLAITSDTDDMAAEMQLVWDVLVPAFGENPLPEDNALHQQLVSKLRSLALKKK